MPENTGRPGGPRPTAVGDRLIELRRPRRCPLNKLAPVVAVLALLGSSHRLQGQSKHTPTLTESLSLKGLSGQQISPDGKFIAYRVRETDWKENAYINQLWLLNTVTGESLQLTRGKKSAGSMEWSPDGRWLAFVTEREQSAILPEEKKAEEKKLEEKKDASKEEDKSADKKDEKKKEEGGDEKP